MRRLSGAPHQLNLKIYKDINKTRIKWQKNLS